MHKKRLSTLPRFLLLLLATSSQAAFAKGDLMQLTSVIVENHAEKIFHDSAAIGMSLVVIDNGQTINRHYGQTRLGSGIRPHQDSLIRIASLTKLMTSQVMVKLAADGKVNITDPLRQHMPEKKDIVLDHQATNPIRLYHLATHTSGLPREQPGRPAKTTVFTWPEKNARWQWIRHNRLAVSPGVRAAYSNLGYDLLADALAAAARKPYPLVFKEKISGPLQMNDTTYTPTTEQCRRLIAGKNAGPCKSSVAAIGSGGVYSTPRDMQRWMQSMLDQHQSKKSHWIDQEYQVFFKRDQLISLQGMDVAGRADGLGLGWVYMKETQDRAAMLQKTGGAGSFLTYMAMVPEKNIGIFIVITRGEGTRFKNMSNGVNRLITELARVRE